MRFVVVGLPDLYAELAAGGHEVSLLDADASVGAVTAGSIDLGDLRQVSIVCPPAVRDRLLPTVSRLPVRLIVASEGAALEAVSGLLAVCGDSAGQVVAAVELLNRPAGAAFPPVVAEPSQEARPAAAGPVGGDVPAGGPSTAGESAGPVLYQGPTPKQEANPQPPVEGLRAVDMPDPPPLPPNPQVVVEGSGGGSALKVGPQPFTADNDDDLPKWMQNMINSSDLSSPTGVPSGPRTAAASPPVVPAAEPAPTPTPTPTPTPAPTPTPTPTPTVEPAAEPTPAPTVEPAAARHPQAGRSETVPQPFTPATDPTFETITHEPSTAAAEPVVVAPAADQPAITTAAPTTGEVPEQARFHESAYDKRFGGAPWANEHTPAASSAPRGTIVAVAAAKGGAGKTTLTCWLAEAMRHNDVPVAVIDANIGQPDVAKVLAIYGQTPGIAALSSERRFTDSELMDASHVVPGLGRVLVGPPEPSEERPNHLLAALGLAAERFAAHHEFVFVDCPVGTVFEPVYTQFVLHVADVLLMVVNPHWPTVQDTLQFVTSLCKPHVEGGLGWSREKMVGVLNQANPTGSGLTLEAIQDATPTLRYVASIPKIRGLVGVVNVGEWQCPAPARQSVAEVVWQLSGGSRPRQAPARKKRRLIGRLMSRLTG